MSSRNKQKNSKVHNEEVVEKPHWFDMWNSDHYCNSGNYVKLSELALAELDSSHEISGMIACMNKKTEKKNAAEKLHVPCLKKIYWPVRGESPEKVDFKCLETDLVWNAVSAAVTEEQKEQTEELKATPFTDLNKCAGVRSGRTFRPDVPASLFGHEGIKVKIQDIGQNFVETRVLYLDYYRIVVWKTQRITLQKFTRSVEKDPFAQCLLSNSTLSKTDNSIVPARELYEFKMANLKEGVAVTKVGYLDRSWHWVTNHASWFTRSSLCQLYDMLHNLESLIESDISLQKTNEDCLEWVKAYKVIYTTGSREHKKSQNWNKFWNKYVPSGVVGKTVFGTVAFLSLCWLTWAALGLTSAIGFFATGLKVGLAVVKGVFMVVQTLFANPLATSSAVLAGLLGSVTTLLFQDHVKFSQQWSKLWKGVPSGRWRVLQEMFEGNKDIADVGRKQPRLRRFAEYFFHLASGGSSPITTLKKTKDVCFQFTKFQWTNKISNWPDKDKITCKHELVARIFKGARQKEKEPKEKEPKDKQFVIFMSEFVKGHYGSEGITAMTITPEDVNGE